MRPWIPAIVVCLALAGCSRSGVFHCTDDRQCTAGRCEPNGYCSMLSGDCPSGFRYDDTAGVDPGQCVLPDDAGIDGLPWMPDARPDAAADAPIDAAPLDAPTDAPLDAPVDATPPDAVPPDAAPPDSALLAARDECAEGLVIPPHASPCVDAVCAEIPDCCSVAWDEACVQQVELAPACARSCSPVSYLADREGFRGRRPSAAGTSRFEVFELRLYDEWYTDYRTNGIALADHDSDGLVDLAVATPHGWWAMTNRSEDGRVLVSVSGGQGTAPTGPREEDTLGGHQIAWADWDHDGDLDLAVTFARGGFHLIRHRRPDGVQFVQVDPPLLPSLVLAFDWGDVDGDGDLDLVVAHDQVARLLLNDGRGNFTATGWRGQAHAGIRLCDLVGDRRPEVIAASVGGEALVYGNDGGLLDEPVTTIPAGNGERYGEIDCADLDRDGDLDVTFGSGTDAMPVVRAFRNGGLRRGLETTPAWQAARAAALDSLDVGDVDGDGDLDLVATFDGAVHWIENRTKTSKTFALVAHAAFMASDQLGVDLGPEPLR